LKESDEPLPVEVWQEYVDRTAEIETCSKCLPVR